MAAYRQGNYYWVCIQVLYLARLAASYFFAWGLVGRVWVMLWQVVVNPFTWRMVMWSCAALRPPYI